MPCPLSVSLSKSGPFPRPALPGVFSRTDLSATLPARPAPHGVPVGACTPPIGLPVLLRLPSSMHAGTPTPAETVRCIYRFSSRSVIGLPLISGGSAPALPVSRPARCSHHIPACMVAKLLNTALCHQSASVYIVTSVGRPGCYQPKATIVGWGSHPPGKRAFPRRTEISGLVLGRRKPRIVWLLRIAGLIRLRLQDAIHIALFAYFDNNGVLNWVALIDRWRWWSPRP